MVRNDAMKKDKATMGIIDSKSIKNADTAAQNKFYHETLYPLMKQAEEGNLVLLFICMGLLCWTIIVPIAAGIAYIVLAVVKIICFFQICSGKAKEPAIIRSFGFLK